MTHRTLTGNTSKEMAMATKGSSALRCIFCHDPEMTSDKLLRFNIGRGISQPICVDCHTEFIGPKRGSPDDDDENVDVKKEDDDDANEGKGAAAAASEAAGGKAARKKKTTAAPRRSRTTPQKQAAKEATARARKETRASNVRGAKAKRAQVAKLHDELAAALNALRDARVAADAAQRVAEQASITVAAKTAELNVWRQATETAERRAAKRAAKGKASSSGGGGGAASSADADDMDKDDEDDDGLDVDEGGIARLDGEFGIDVSKNATPEDMYNAIMLGNVDIVRRMLKNNRRLAEEHLIDEDEDIDETPLYTAAREGHADVVAELLAAGAHPDTGNATGDTALHVAAENDRTETVHALIDGGADPTVKNDYGETPGAVAEDYNHHDLAAYLFKFEKAKKAAKKKDKSKKKDDDSDGDIAGGRRNPANPLGVRAGRVPYVSYTPAYHNNKGRYQRTYDRIVKDEELFPRRGLPSSTEAKWIVAISNAYHRFYNDGDIFYLGPEAEEAAAALRALMQTRDVFDHVTEDLGDYGDDINEMFDSLEEGLNKVVAGALPRAGFGFGGASNEDEDDDDTYETRKRAATRLKRSAKKLYPDGWVLTSAYELVDTSLTEAAERWFPLLDKWTYNMYNMRAMDLLIDAAIEAAAKYNPKVAAWLAQETGGASSSSAAAAAASTPGFSMPSRAPSAGTPGFSMPAREPSAATPGFSFASSPSKMDQKKMQFRLVSSSLAPRR